MICIACKENRHSECQGGDCQCQDRLEKKLDQELATFVNPQNDEVLAETIYSNLLYSGSAAARILVDGAGKSVVKLFIQQILRANKASRC